MAVVVFDADVLIAFLNREDANHANAVERMREAFEPGNRLMVSAVNYTEVLIGPLRAKTYEQRNAALNTIDAMLGRVGLEVINVDMDLAKRAAAVRARTKLKLPDAYAVATAIHAEHRGFVDVRLETFDKKVIRAYDDLHPLS